MKCPKYNFYIGKLKSNFAVRLGYYNGSTFVEDNTRRASVITALPESKRLFILVNPQSANATVNYFNAANTAVGNAAIKKGIMFASVMSAENYAIQYRANDKAFANDYFIAELQKITPHYKSLSKKYAKESSQEFFRTSLDGKISLIGDDYEVIKAASIEDKFVFCIEKNSDSGTSLYYAAIFSKTDCKFGHVKKSCELSNLTTADQYVNVLNKYEDTYDLIKLAPAITSVNITKRCAVQIYILGGSTISTFFNGTYVEEDVDNVIDSDTELRQTYHFALINVYSELHSAAAPGYANSDGEYVESEGTWSNSYGYTLKLEKVATAGDHFDGDYAVDTIYNINTGESLYNQKVVGSGETSNVVFNYDTYALRLFRRSGTLTVLAESTILFHIPDLNNIYFSVTFGSITMKMSDSDSTYKLTDILTYWVYQRLLCDVDSVLGVATSDIPNNDIVSSSSNYSKVVGLEDNVLGNIYHTNYTVIEPTKYGKNDIGMYFTDDFLPSIIGVSRLLPVCRSYWGNTSIWFAYNESMWNTIETTARKTYTLKDAYAISAVIKTLLAEIDPSIQHEATSEYSNFLYGSTSINNVGFRLFITPKSNILKGEYDQAAQKAEITLKDLMEMLANCYQCYWYIDDNNRFIIEHIYYFNNNLSYTTQNSYQIDLTKLKDAFNKRVSGKFQQEIEYSKSDLPKRYEFGWMDEATELFDSVNLDINSNYVQQDKTEDITISQFSSDIDFMLYDPDNFSEDGFTLLAAISSNSIYNVPIVSVTVLDYKGRSYATTVQNWYASWSYLAQRMYSYNMPAQNGNINTLGPLSAVDLIRSMAQDIEFQSEEDPDSLQLIHTSFGNGKIDEMSINIDTRLVKATLKYKPS